MNETLVRLVDDDDIVVGSVDGMDLVIVVVAVVALGSVTNGRSNNSLLTSGKDDEGIRKVTTVKSKRNAIKLTRINRFPITMLPATRR